MTSGCPTDSHFDTPTGLPNHPIVFESDLRRAIGRGEPMPTSLLTIGGSP